MKNINSPLMVMLTRSAIAGNVLFLLWILYNGIDEHFEGRIVEKVSYLVLMMLLSLNVFLLRAKFKKKTSAKAV